MLKPATKRRQRLKTSLQVLFDCLKKGLTYFEICGGSRNLVGIAIQLSDSEQEKLLVGYSMLISPEKFDFGVE